MANWKVVRITLPPRYYRPGIYPALERSILRYLVSCGGLEQALDQSLIQEVHAARQARPARRFLIHLSDARWGHAIPISFSLSCDGTLL